MRLRYRLPIYLMIMGLGLALLGACAPAAKEEAKPTQRIQIVAGSMGGLTYTWSAAVTKVLNKYYPEIDWSNRSGGGPENAKLIESGEIAMGMYEVPTMFFTYAEKGPEQRHRIIWAIAPAYSIYILPKDSTWKTISDIPKGTSWAVGKSGSGFVFQSRDIYEALGLKPDDYKWQYLGSGDAARAWRDGTIDVGGLGIGVPAPPLIDMCTSKRGATKLIDFTKEDIQKVINLRPAAGYFLGTIAKDSIDKGCPEKDYNVLAYNVFVWARDDYSQDIIYKMVKTINEHLKEITDMYVTAKASTPEATVNTKGVYKLHAGTEKYLKEIGALK